MCLHFTTVRGAHYYLSLFLLFSVFVLRTAGASLRRSISPSSRVSSMWTRCWCRRRTMCDTRTIAAMITPRSTCCTNSGNRSTISTSCNSSNTITKPTVHVRRPLTHRLTTVGRRPEDGSAYRCDSKKKIFYIYIYVKIL